MICMGKEALGRGVRWPEIWDVGCCEKVGTRPVALLPVFAASDPTFEPTLRLQFHCCLSPASHCFFLNSGVSKGCFVNVLTNIQHPQILY